MKKNETKLTILMLLTLFSLSPVISKDTDVEAAEVAYSVQKIDPGNEVKKGSSFYDLQVKPGEERTIKAKLINSATEKIVVQSSVYTAETSNHGQINSASELTNLDETLTHKLSDIAKVVASDVNAEVDGESTKEISVKIKVPEDLKDGVILGTWYFEKADQVKADKDSKGLSIDNKYSYSIDVKLTVNKEINTPNLNLLDVDGGIQEYKKAFMATIQNDQPAIVSKLAISARVFAKGKHDVLFESTREEMRMAPNSHFQFPVFLKQEPMKAGSYTMEVVATTKDPKWDNKTWEWVKDFTITSDVAAKANKEAINDPEEPFNWVLWLVVGIGLALLVLVLIVLVVKNKGKKQREVRRKKVNKTNSQSRRKSKRR